MNNKTKKTHDTLTQCMVTILSDKMALNLSLPGVLASLVNTKMLLL